MWLDIGIIIFFLISLSAGWRTGFIRGLLGFVSNIVAIVVALAFARPFANLLDFMFNTNERFDGLPAVSGAFLNFLLALCTLYIVVRILFFALGLVIRLVKRRNQRLDRMDKIAGIFLGFCKWAISLVVFFVILHFTSNIPLVGNAIAWLFTAGLWESVLGTAVSDFTLWWALPVLERIQVSALVLLTP